MANHSDEKNFSHAEKFLMLIAAVVFLAMSYAYFADISIKRLLFPSAEDQFLSTPIGKVTALTGQVLRQRATEFEFKVLAVGDSLYPNDTIMTGPSSTAAIELIKDQKFDMSPNSLVKLTFGSDFSVTGVVRVELLKASTKADEQAAAPKKPLQILTPHPAPQSVITLNEDDFNAQKKTLQLGFTTSRPPEEQLSIHVFTENKNGGRQELASATPAATYTTVEHSFGFTAPGLYSWEVHDASGKTLGSFTFEISRKVMLIKTLPTLNDSNRLEGLATKKVFDGFVVRWKPIPGPGLYRVRVTRASDDRIVLQKEMPGTQLILNKNNIILGKLQFWVEKDTGTPFIATSPKQTFGFEFLPPEPTSPPANANFTDTMLDTTNGLIFFTWSKTNYTDAYEFELASDQEFRNTILKKVIRDNFQSFKSPKAGRYFWRVRSSARGLWSDFSRTRSLTIAP